MGPHGMCGEHRDLDMERGREKGEGSGREAEQWSKVFNLFVSIAMCHLAHQWCGVQQEVTKCWSMAALAPARRDGCNLLAG